METNGKRKHIVCAAALFACAAAFGVFAWRLRDWGTYLHFDTMFGKARVYQVEDDEGEPVRLLEVGGIVQSGTYLDERYTELVFEYLKHYDALFDELPAVRRICVLGCGGYDYPEHLIANHPGVIVDAVEIDPAITTIARRYFYLDRLIEEYETESTGRLNLICDDALAFLKRDSTAPADGGNDPAQGAFAARTDRELNAKGAWQRLPVLYDAIVNDTFDAGTPPAHLTTREFAQAVRARLVPGGLYLTNIVSALEGPRSTFLHEQVALLRSVFDDVHVIPCATDDLQDEDNVIVIARTA